MSALPGSCTARKRGRCCDDEDDAVAAGAFAPLPMSPHFGAAPFAAAAPIRSDYRPCIGFGLEMGGFDPASFFGGAQTSSSSLEALAPMSQSDLSPVTPAAPYSVYPSECPPAPLPSPVISAGILVHDAPTSFPVVGPAAQGGIDRGSSMPVISVGGVVLPRLDVPPAQFLQDPALLSRGAGGELLFTMGRRVE